MNRKIVTAILLSQLMGGCVSAAQRQRGLNKAIITPLALGLLTPPASHILIF